MRAPTSTYRLQITAELDLFRAAELLPYLHDLGADWVYLSPILEAEPGSTHGYDVIRHDRVDPARGGEEGLAALSAEARRLGMGVLVDIVPNHVGVATPSEDPWWWDVLKHGREAEHAPAFDIDWDASHQKLQIPVVGDDDEGAIEVDLGAEEIRYHDNRFPLAPGTTTLEEQHYELVNWREADDGLNYRRFFAVNTLAAVRVEEPGVFEDTHVEIRRWFDEGLVDGLRVDHPDGLRDPGGYLRDLAELTGDAYVLVEKILEPGEQLLTSWATAGTTGYDALAHIDRVLTDPAGQAPLDALEARLRGGPVDWAEMIHDTKRAVADGILNSEVRRIVRDLRRHLPVVPAFRAEDAVAELLACFPVYRSYLPEGRAHLEEAFAEARRRRPDLTLTLGRIEPWMFDADLAASKRFQQTSGMVMAKGVEDCAFYRYSRLTSLNEVGGDPSVFSLDVAGFHRLMAERQRDWPHAMTTLSTHDTKRGEDVRARITALAELPAAWEAALGSLLSLAPLPDPGFASLLWQAVLGAWPASASSDWRSRLHGYAEKAMREAGDRTTWTEPDEAYESAVHAAVDAALDSAAVRGVIEDLLAQVVAPGWSNALAAKLVALTMPGVPDVYQGSEMWEQSLVDPDNRRPVDFGARAELLRSGSWSAPQPVLDDGGSAKLHLTATSLRLRRDRPELFTSYDAVAASGPATDHVVAFDRGGAVTVATRLPVGLAARGGWGPTTLELPPGHWTDALGSWSGSGPAPLAEVLADLPVALLVRSEES
ncbi:MULTISPECIES: malto-oligosyltrehalose synthase [unclassified Nocardioides]|uniref:malto-oligosyltrehalose synthase n=1 Tax=unclassified Nocardioides TaxID=2615069 RepID=UPI0030154814